MYMKRMRLVERTGHLQEMFLLASSMTFEAHSGAATDEAIQMHTMRSLYERATPEFQTPFIWQVERQ